MRPGQRGAATETRKPENEFLKFGEFGGPEILPLLHAALLLPVKLDPSRSSAMFFNYILRLLI